MTEPVPLDLTKPQIRAITFEPDAIVIEYCIPQYDARANGVVLNHVLMIPSGDQYDDEMDELHAAVLALLNDVLEDLPDMEPIRLRSLDDEDPDDGDDD